MTVVTFHVGPVLCGADVRRVQEVLRHQELTPIPLSAPATPGLLHLRGQILTGINLRSLFALEEGEPTTRPVCVIVRDGESAASLMADRVGEVVEIDEGALLEAPAHWQGPLRDFVYGVIDRDDRLLRLLDISKILDIESDAEADSNSASE